ncbi:MAG: hypothetical protein ACOJUL_11440 [Candidatus Pollutiaquabacter aromativorans]
MRNIFFHSGSGHIPASRYLSLMNRFLCLLLICIIGQIRLSAQGILDTLGNTIVRIETAVDSAQFAGGYASGPWDLHIGS